MKPVVSVILPVKNGAQFIEEALVSVENSLCNKEHEIIIVDDGSTDELDAILIPWKKKVTYFRQRNLGVSAARNAGLREAKGSYIAFIDADDLWTTHHFEFLYRELKKSGAEVCMGYTQRFEISSNGEKKSVGDPLLFPAVGPSLFKRSIFEKVGFFEPTYDLHEDIDWYLRAIEKDFHVVVVPEVVLNYRIHQHNSTKKWQPQDKSMVRILAHSLKRRKNKKLPSLKSFEI